MSHDQQDGTVAVIGCDVRARDVVLDVVQRVGDTAVRGLGGVLQPADKGGSE